MTRKVGYLPVPLLLTILLCSTAIAQQQTKEERFYRLDFVLQEHENGKLVNSRNYSMWLSSGEGRGGGASIRAGIEMPYVRTVQGEQPASINYRRLGVSIDCRLTESANGIVLQMNGSISKAVPPPQGQDSKLSLPVLQSFDFNAYALLTPDKATPISSVDDPDSNRRFQLSVTAVKLH